MSQTSGPESMRQAMADYVAGVHRAYLEATQGLAPADRGRLPLTAAGSFTVAAIGTRNLHVIATTDRLPPPQGPEVAIDAAEGDLTWTLRFFDPVVLPALGLLDESEGARPERVRDLLGIGSVVYHLTVPPGGGLSAHHALHSGTGLAHTHAAASRDYDSIAALLPERSDAVIEMRAAEAAELGISVLLLARLLAPSDPELAGMAPGTPAQDVRRRLLTYLRGPR